jgi:hypothetical protein
MNIGDLKRVVVNCHDTSVAEYKEDILEFLHAYESGFCTHAMSDYQAVLEGQKQMLSAMIDFIERS